MEHRESSQADSGSDAFWYKSGVIYEMHVRSFHDGNGDGVGDFPGLSAKLDYLVQLGVTALWLLPFYPSPLKDDGYDIADYRDVHPRYGTLADFKTFLREAHRRGLRVITELVLNHTSDQHPWFQRARRAKPGTRWRNFYLWSDTAEKFKEARIIFKDVETSNWAWDHAAGSYYWHRFFAHQPDLNFDNPEVRQEIVKVLDFWLDLGVDGLRLDAVPYLYEREGTSCENLPETHEFLRDLRRHLDARYQNRALVAEANQWPEDAVAYFGQGRGDECHMAFHFPLMPRLFMAVRMEDRTPILDILQQTPRLPETCQWALFLRNHDELTLEMVTDEERDYMYRVYADKRQARLNLGIRRRLAPLLGNDRKRVELLNGILLSLPGTPVIYYGDEIGMGDNIYLGDRNGVRTPMQWSSDKNAGFSRANPQSLYLPVIVDPEYHYETVNVEAQLGNPHSLLWWMRRVLALRKRWRALGEGQCELLQPENRRILAYVLRHEQETLLVVANLSRFAQPVELDLSALAQRVPVELFGRTEFPAITERPYLLTLGPHGLYWFALEPRFAAADTSASSVIPGPEPAPRLPGDWRQLVENRRAGLETILPAYLKLQPWFAGKARTLKSLALLETIIIPLANGRQSYFTLLHVEYLQGDAETYVLPLAYAAGSEADQVRREFPRLVVAEVGGPDPGSSGLLYDAICNPAFGQALLELLWRRRRLKHAPIELAPTRTAELSRILAGHPLPSASFCKAEQRNSSVFYEDKLVLKLFRRLEPGINPEVELGCFLAERRFLGSPPLAGAFEIAGPWNTPATLAVFHASVPNAKNARDYALDALSRYYDRIGLWVAQGRQAPQATLDLTKLLDQEPPPEVVERLGAFAESARLLGQRAAELHLALASAAAGEEFAPEPFTPYYQRSLYQSMRSRAVQTLLTLRQRLKVLAPDALPLAQRVLAAEPAMLQLLRALADRRLNAKRIRVHGDCHLGQVLWTGKDFVFVDFEGEPWTPMSERRFKRSPLRDVVGLMRSFHQAAHAGLEQHVQRGGIPREQLPRFEAWAQDWTAWISAAFLQAYLRALGPSDLLPRTVPELQVMLRAYLLNGIVHELSDELDRRSDQPRAPLWGILHLAGG